MYVQTVLSNREVKWPIQNVKTMYRFSFEDGAVRSDRWKKKLGTPNLVMTWTVPTSLLQLIRAIPSNKCYSEFTWLQPHPVFQYFLSNVYGNI